MKLQCVVSLRLGLKGMNIVRNIVKVGVHACLSNGHPNLLLNFISQKLLKSETLHAASLGLVLKGVKIAQNVAKVGVHAYLSNTHPNL